MPKVEVDKLTLGYSPLSETVYAGTLHPAGKTWAHKKDVDQQFLDCVIQRWENQTEVIESGDNKWEITVKKIK